MLTSLLACVAGFVLDFFLGDPVWLYHPVRLIGKELVFGEKILRRICGEKGGNRSLAAAGALLWLRPVMYVAFDREFARSRGIHTRVISYLMAALVAVTIVLSIRIMGIVLLISLLTMPVVIVNTFTRSYRRIAAAAPVVAVAGNVAGLAASYHFEVPPGAAIIFTLTLTLIGVKLLTLHSKNRRVSA